MTIQFSSASSLFVFVSAAFLAAGLNRRTPEFCAKIIVFREMKAYIVHRPAVAADLPRIVQIYNATVASRMVTADLEPVSVESRQRWFEEHRPESRPLWVVERDGEIAAWLSVSSFYGRPAYAGTAEISVYVDEGSRRRGLGGYLLRAAIAHAPELGVCTLLGFIFAHNLPSLALFENFGFEHWGRLPRVALLDELERDLVIVGRRVEWSSSGVPLTTKARRHEQKQKKRSVGGGNAGA
jgi:L-amino acid N-acyltransferase YncA